MTRHIGFFCVICILSTSFWSSKTSTFVGLYFILFVSTNLYDFCLPPCFNLDMNAFHSPVLFYVEVYVSSDRTLNFWCKSRRVEILAVAGKECSWEWNRLSSNFHFIQSPIELKMWIWGSSFSHVTCQPLRRPIRRTQRGHPIRRQGQSSWRSWRSRPHLRKQIWNWCSRFLRLLHGTNQEARTGEKIVSENVGLVVVVSANLDWATRSKLIADILVNSEKTADFQSFRTAVHDEDFDGQFFGIKSYTNLTMKTDYL